MGYAIMHLPQGDVVLADERGWNECLRDYGLPHYDHRAGKFVTEAEIKAKNQTRT